MSLLENLNFTNVHVFHMPYYITIWLLMMTHDKSGASQFTSTGGDEYVTEKGIL